MGVLKTKFVLGVFIFIEVVICFNTLKAQQNSVTQKSEYLKNVTYEELHGLIVDVYEDTIQSKKYLNLYLNKAIKEDNQLEEALATGWIALYTKDESKKLDLLDKAIELSKEYKGVQILPFLYKGSHYLNKRDFKTGLENYLAALELSKEINSVDYEFITKHNIGIIKGEVGKYEEALELFRESFEYEKSTGDFKSHGYITSLLYVSEYLIKLDSIDKAREYLQEGLIKSDGRINNLHTELLLQRGILEYKSKDLILAKRTFSNCLDKIEKDLPQHQKPHILALYYIGKIEAEIGNKNLALKMFKKVDSIIQTKQYPLADVRDGYQFIIEFYHQTDNLKNELEYLNKLLFLDSINSKNGIEVNQALFTDFDTPDLLENKNQIIKKLEQGKTNNTNILIITSIVSFSIFLSFLIVLRQNQGLKKKFNELIQGLDKEREDNSTEEKIIEPQKDLNIQEEITLSILEQLEIFESEKKYVDNNITLNNLALSFKTNTKYLSMVINKYKKKNFSSYLKDLRIQLAIRELKDNEKMRNLYTIEGISKEFGFNNPESFSLAFKKNTGLKPSYFIKELNKQSLNS